MDWKEIKFMLGGEEVGTATAKDVLNTDWDLSFRDKDRLKKMAKETKRITRRSIGRMIRKGKVLLPFLLMILAFSSCKKDSSTTSNNGSNNDTIVRQCRYVEQTTYDPNNNVTLRSNAYYTGTRLDSILTSSGARTIYTYTSSSQRTSATYISGALQNYSYKETLDASGNVIRSDYYVNGTLQSYFTSTFNCN